MNRNRSVLGVDVAWPTGPTGPFLDGRFHYAPLVADEPIITWQKTEEKSVPLPLSLVLSSSFDFSSLNKQENLLPIYLLHDTS